MRVRRWPHPLLLAWLAGAPWILYAGTIPNYYMIHVARVPTPAYATGTVLFALVLLSVHVGALAGILPREIRRWSGPECMLATVVSATFLFCAAVMAMHQQAAFVAYVQCALVLSSAMLLVTLVAGVRAGLKRFGRAEGEGP